MNSHFPNLHMPPCQLSLRTEGSHTQVFDIARRRHVALTPEEWVRQHVVHALHHHLGYPLETMLVEGCINLNGLSRRCDIVIYNTQLQPLMIVECKQPSVALTQKVIDQICRYNQALHVPYLYLTNGLQHIVCKADFDQQTLLPLQAIPTWEEINNY